MYSDHEIIETLNDNLSKGTQQLVDRYYCPLIFFARTITRNEANAQDIVQDVFYQFCLRKIYRTISAKALSTYLFTAIRNRTLNSLRHTDRLTTLEDISYEIIVQENSLENVQLIEDVHSFVRNLPERTQYIVREVILNERSYKEVAEEQHISVNTLKTLLKTGLKQLRREFAHEL